MIRALFLPVTGTSKDGIRMIHYNGEATMFLSSGSKIFGHVSYRDESRAVGEWVTETRAEQLVSQLPRREPSSKWASYRDKSRAVSEGVTETRAEQ